MSQESTLETSEFRNSSFKDPMNRSALEQFILVSMTAPSTWRYWSKFKEKLLWEKIKWIRDRKNGMGGAGSERMGGGLYRNFWRVERLWVCRMLVCKDVTSMVISKIVMWRGIGKEWRMMKKRLVSLMWEGKDWTEVGDENQQKQRHARQRSGRKKTMVPTELLGLRILGRM